MEIYLHISNISSWTCAMNKDRFNFTFSNQINLATNTVFVGFYLPMAVRSSSSMEGSCDVQYTYIYI
jgi:hypothetical protein